MDPATLLLICDDDTGLCPRLLDIDEWSLLRRSLDEVDPKEEVVKLVVLEHDEADGEIEGVDQLHLGVDEHVATDVVEHLG